MLKLIYVSNKFKHETRNPKHIANNLFVLYECTFSVFPEKIDAYSCIF